MSENVNLQTAGRIIQGETTVELNAWPFAGGDSPLILLTPGQRNPRSRGLSIPMHGASWAAPVVPVETTPPVIVTDAIGQEVELWGWGLVND